MQPLRALLRCASVLGFGLASSMASGREPKQPDAETRDTYVLRAHGETHALLFQRALLPGSRGALVSTETLLPVYQYWVLSARDIDATWQRDSLDVDVALWGRAALFDNDREGRLNGDVQSANVRYRHGPAALRLGRQHVAGGAARYARFDGANLELSLGNELSLSAYAGFAVMPRWNERPGYQYLGAVTDSEIRELARTPLASRDAQWLTGGRVAWARRDIGLGLTWHERHETGGVSHRSLGLDTRARIGAFGVGGNAILELESSRFADASLFVDYAPLRNIDVSLEYLHTEPALLLSRQSVLSVFSRETYEETGGFTRYRPTPELLLEAGGFVQWFASGRPGRRAEFIASSWLDAERRSLLRANYTRVITPDNAYWSLRGSLLRQLGTGFRATVDAYLYLYDHAIEGYRSATVYAGTLSYQPLRELNVLWGASLARTPLAGLDAQTQLRVACDFDWVTHGGRR
ncbi:MAG TPA: hypothetical protein VFQ61_10570 [Polyangiaceae bacterium]|nr:hypothetical protein [Polyangiaceae bacterium]